MKEPEAIYIESNSEGGLKFCSFTKQNKVAYIRADLVVKADITLNQDMFEEGSETDSTMNGPCYCCKHNTKDTDEWPCMACEYC